MEEGSDFPYAKQFFEKRSSLSVRNSYKSPDTGGNKGVLREFGHASNRPIELSRFDFHDLLGYERIRNRAIICARRRENERGDTRDEGKGREGKGRVARDGTREIERERERMRESGRKRRR